MPYPSANTFTSGVTTPSTALEAPVNSFGFDGNSHTQRVTENDLQQAPMSPYIRNPYSTVLFDGANDYVSRGGNLTGLSAPISLFTMAMQFRLESQVACSLLTSNLTAICHLQLSSVGGLSLVASNTTEDAGFATTQLATAIAPGRWHTIHVAGRTDTGTLTCWVNGTRTYNFSAGADLGAVNWNAFTNWRVGINSAANGGRLHAAVRFVWFDVGQYVTDPTKFTLGNLGAQGTGTGLTRPLVYLTGNAAAWQAGTNGGTGGAFTATGTFTDV